MTTIGPFGMAYRHRLVQILLPWMMLIGIVAPLGCGAASNGHNVEGVSLYKQGQYHAALQRFQNSVNADPMNSDGYYNLASTYHQLGKANNDPGLMTQSESLYNQALEHDPTHADAYRGLAVLLTEKGRSDSAFRLLEGWATRQPQLADPKIELARLHEEGGDDATAKAHLEEALMADTSSARAWAALARLREKSGDYSQALANYQRSYQLNSLQPEIASRIAALRGGMSATATAAAPAVTGRPRVASQPVPRLR